MRYAPTPVRLISGIDWVDGWFRFRPLQGVCDTPLHLFDCFLGIYWVICWFRFRPREGVCDTPLHMFDCILGLIGLRVDFLSAHIRAYAIRPYTCSIVFWD